MDELDLGATIRGFSTGQRIFSRYTLKSLLGRGGMGVVWRARDESLERDVAIKMLPEIVANDPVAVRELKRETIRSQQLNHPQILRIYDFVEGGGLCGITMEIVEGGTLSARRLELPGEVFGIEALAPLVKQLCAALDYAHADAQIVHRDLKPANLMLDASGRLKVMDFGIAASLSESVSRVSNRSSSSGTPSYMSPQQFRGLDSTVSDDLYSLGATLYELLCGQPPFKARDAAALMHQVFNEPPQSLNARRAKTGQPPVPVAWEETIAACLAKEPGDRPQSAGEVAARLGLGAAPSVGMPTGGMATKNAKSAKAERTISSSQAPTPRSKTSLISAIAGGVILLAGLGYYFGIHAPEQQRLAAEQKQQTAEQARLAEIKRLENEARILEAKRLAETKRQEDERLLAENARLEKQQQAEELRLRTEREKQEALVREQQQREAARLANARGGIIVRTTPAGAEVTVGALEHGNGPLTIKEARLGKYPVKVRAAGYEDWAGEAEVKENEFTELQVALVRSTGRLLISGPEGAVVFEGSVRRGQVPLTLEGIPTGMVRYSVSLTGYKTGEVSGEVLRNAETHLRADLVPQVVPQPGKPWENSLGQKFVPVSGTAVLFCIWETRVQDFEAFVRETKHDATKGAYSMRLSSHGFGLWGEYGDNWRSPGFAQGPTHPVVAVNYSDAVAFCKWLTDSERRKDRLAANQEYRLPTNAEWDAAVGRDEFPWGAAWPPPRGAGNYASIEARDRDWNTNKTIIRGYADGFGRTAPVGSYSPNRLGIFDLGGNVTERSTTANNAHGGRGGSFYDDERDKLGSANWEQSASKEGGRMVHTGFRVVCTTGALDQKGAEEISAPDEKAQTRQFFERASGSWRHAANNRTNSEFIVIRSDGTIVFQISSAGMPFETTARLESFDAESGRFRFARIATRTKTKEVAGVWEVLEGALYEDKIEIPRFNSTYVRDRVSR